jgi:hypothetical protein
VVGEATWTSADGLDITMRLAVHAVRRVPGGTVLDWSVTPLHGRGLRPNDPLPQRSIWGSVGQTIQLPARSTALSAGPATCWLEAVRLADTVAVEGSATSLRCQCGCHCPLGEGCCRRELADQFDDVGDGVDHMGWSVREAFHVLGLRRAGQHQDGAHSCFHA